MDEPVRHARDPRRAVHSVSRTGPVRAGELEESALRRRLAGCLHALYVKGRAEAPHSAFEMDFAAVEHAAPVTNPEPKGFE